ncbi:LysR family transcriptional regulator [Defluviimonas denitrificans]|jgi:DNA-binding transcriptional LysR family regulator|uniref:LysR family transcriptional regulator n=1 Tax=Albidovulum denitrificans TaxID=404881 RepID=A0A2S8S694_9RHOB|nr:LysR family transcriptional regulator [Defluviimonas denitrificans]PQV56312.1 LysR family transcriptional regulator [Defluviimonas denitrificans]
MQFNWDDVRIFLEIERTGRLSRAAKRLGVSHTTIARRIRQMEARFGCHLFEPTDDGLILTAAGSQVLQKATEMENAAVDISDRLARLEGKNKGRVRVGAPDGFGNAVLSHILPELVKENPGTEVEFVPVPASHKLWRRDVDIAVSLDRPLSGQVIMRKLTDYDLRLYAGPGFFDGKNVPTCREELREYPFVGYIDELLYTPELDFNRAILPGLNVVYRAATVKAQFDAVKNNAGLGVLPCFMTRNTNLLPIMPEEINFVRTYWLLYPEEYRLLSHIQLVSNFIHNRTREMYDIFRCPAT